jgi:hypothetical protein
LQIITVSLIAISTLLAGTAFAAQPNHTQTHPATQTQLPREPMPTVIEILPAGVPKDKTKRCPQWEPKFAQHGLPVKTFSYIAWRESRCRIKAHNTTLNRNKSQDLGLVQINSSWKTVTSKVCKSPYGDLTVLFNVDCNLKVAKYLYDNGGLGHWSL